MLACKGSARPDRFDISGDQVFYILDRCRTSDPQKITTCLETFSKIDLIAILRVGLLDPDVHDDGRAEIIKYCPCPHFINNVFILFRMKIINA